MMSPADKPTDDAQPAQDAEAAGPPADAAGISNVFEVEEQAPDGGSADDIADASPTEPAPRSKAAPAPASPAVDDDEEVPTLVWYVLKVQSGREDTIRDALERRVKIQGLETYFGRIVVPTEKTTEIRNNKKRVVERKSYPGYLMVEMELNEKTWFVVRETPGVGDFVGAHGTPSKMPEEEVNKMLGRETAKEEKPPQLKIDVERGDRVKIKDGPFENFEGTVEEVIEARGLVKVMLTIFNRPTPVDLEYWQVERI
jgi:transcriptional antiterminator NusG